jgi:hypothetical protein
LILGADDHFIGIAIHGDKAFGFLYLLHQIVDGHGLGPRFRSADRAEAARGHTRPAAWQSLFTVGVRLSSLKMGPEVRIPLPPALRRRVLQTLGPWEFVG